MKPKRFQSFPNKTDLFILFIFKFLYIIKVADMAWR
jgi:hypothetical protein